jgi:hypothetical protein
MIEAHRPDFNIPEGDPMIPQVMGSVKHVMVNLRRDSAKTLSAYANRQDSPEMKDDHESGLHRHGNRVDDFGHDFFRSATAQPSLRTDEDAMG